MGREFRIKRSGCPGFRHNPTYSVEYTRFSDGAVLYILFKISSGTRLRPGEVYREGAYVDWIMKMSGQGMPIGWNFPTDDKTVTRDRPVTLRTSPITAFSDAPTTVRPERSRLQQAAAGTMTEYIAVSCRPRQRSRTQRSGCRHRSGTCVLR